MAGFNKKIYINNNQNNFFLFLSNFKSIFLIIIVAYKKIDFLKKHFL